MPVDTDKRQIRGNLQIGVVGQGDDPIHFVLPYHVQTPLFRLPVVVGDRDNGPVIPAGQLSDHGIGQVSKEGVAESRPDESDRIGPVGLEAAGITVDTIAQFVGSGQHFSRYSSRTGRLLYTLETVPRATPASAATSEPPHIVRTVQKRGLQGVEQANQRLAWLRSRFARPVFVWRRSWL